MAAGDLELARRKFEVLKEKTDAMTQQAIEQRLSRGLAPTSLLSAREIAVVDEAAVEHRHEEVFAARPSLFSRAALGVQLLIAANLAMFGLEIFAGGATEGDVLFRLGAMYGPAVHAGEWWRLVASMFLHFGVGHLVFNLMALAVLGPFVEGAFRYVKFLAVYFLSGVGSMLVVMALTRWEEHQLTVGASGAILGLAGATAALMLKGWRRERAQQARKRLWTLVLIIVLQTVIDLMTPQISMTAHLSGAVIGFVVAMILRDHLPREGGVIATAS
jgi:rhomboid protease GluP